MKHSIYSDVIAALKIYRQVLGLKKSDINPNKLYRLTTYDGMPALQDDPHGYYFGMFGAEILELLNQ